MDDTERLSHDRMKSLGFGFSVGVYTIKCDPATSEPWTLNVSFSGWGTWIHCEGTDVPLPRPLPETVGDVRRLLSALGIG